LLNAQRSVLDSQMDARLESRIKFLRTIRGKKEDAFVVFEEAEEDGDEGVANEVVFATLGQENIRFIEQENGAPGFCALKDCAKLFVRRFDVGSKFAAANDVEGFVRIFGYTF
jgi:hypothetical protein